MHNALAVYNKPFALLSCAGDGADSNHDWAGMEVTLPTQVSAHTIYMSRVHGPICLLQMPMGLRIVDILARTW